MSKKVSPQYNKYSAKNIKIIEPYEHVRRRPEMYFGGRDKRALHHLIDVVIDFSLESVFIQKCDAIEIRLQADDYVTISDNDFAFSKALSDNDYDTRRNHLELDGIFSLVGQRPGARAYDYQVSGGLHGVGIVSINAVSSLMSVTVKRDHLVMKRTYRKGKPSGAYQKYEVHKPQQSGVLITFQPDFTIFEKHKFDYEWIAKRCREITLTQPYLTITLIDERSPKIRQDVFHYPDGIPTIVRELNERKTPVHDILYIRNQVPLKVYQEEEIIHVEIAMQFTESDDIELHGYVNTIYSEHGGTHLEGFRNAMMGYLYAGKETPHYWNNAGRGLTAVINLLHPKYGLTYESQSRLRLLTPTAFEAVAATTYQLLIQSNLREIFRRRR